MSIERISIVLVVTIVSIHCTSTWDAAAVTTPKPTYLVMPVPDTKAALSAELLDVVKKFQTTSSETSATTAAPVPPSSDRISVMHFPALDQSALSAAKSTASSLVPGVLHPQSLGLDLHVPDNRMIEKPSSPALPVVPAGIVPPPADAASSSPPAIHSETQPIVPVGLSPKFNLQELHKLLADLRMTPVTPQTPLASAPNPAVTETLPPLSSGSKPQLPDEVSLPMLKPNQTPLDYLLSSSSPINLPKIPLRDSSNPSPTTKPRPNLEFVKYLLTLPRYQQALIDLIKTQS